MSFWGTWALRDVDWKLYKFLLAIVDGALYYVTATIQFNSDFSGEGLISVFAEDVMGSGYIEHLVELEEL